MISATDYSSSFARHSDGNTRAERSAISSREAAHDAELIRRFNAGDAPAFAEINNRYRERMYVIAFNMLKNHADAEEVAQDTLLRAHRALHKFRGDSSLATWLHRIAVNLARNRYWYHFRRRRHSTVSLDSMIGESSSTTFCDLIVSDAAGPEREAQAKEFTERVAICMARLDPAPRAILTLRNLKNRSYTEISAELGVNIGTVKSRLARAREMLRVLLTQVYPEFGPNSEPAEWFEAARPGAGIVAVCA